MRILKVPRNAITNAKPIRKRFVIHEHHATRLHFDLRLEIGGTGKSWAVPKGPSMDPDDKRLAVAVPDHSLSYFKYEGTLAEGTYGAGEVRIWDSGKFETLVDPQLQYDEGRIEFSFLGKKVRGEFILVRMSPRANSPKSTIQNAKSVNWLLIKRDDQYADIDWRLKTILPVKTR
ncbi:MAG: 3'-phosphoesterase [Blastocatellia bacterium]|nr:3'-phosphoesterase [Blastocatellia bacterium]